MGNSSIGPVQFAALIDTLRIYSLAIAAMIKIKCDKQTLGFAQDDKHFRHSRAGGNGRHFVAMALVSLRGNDRNLRNLVRFNLCIRHTCPRRLERLARLSFVLPLPLYFGSKIFPF
jgi:hypothetical protein